MVFKLGGSDDDAKEIFQEGLMVIINKADNINFRLTCQLKTYLFCICKNLWKSELEKKKAEENYFLRKVEDEEVSDFTENQDYKLREEIFYGAFETLDTLHQKILKLYWQDLSIKEIGELLGYSAAYIKKEKCIGQSELVKRVKAHRDFKLLVFTG